MVKKIVRDIQIKDIKEISLRQEPESKKVIKRSDVLDCSNMIRKKKKKVQSLKKASTLDDINKKNQKEEKVVFLHIDAKSERRIGSIYESLRIGAIGVLILFTLNIVNVYQRGIVLKNSVLASASSGYEELLQAGDDAINSNFGSAEISFDQANGSFKSAQEAIAFLRLNEELFFAREKTVESVDNLLSAAEHISNAGTNFSRGIENLRNLPERFINENGIESIKNREQKKSLTDKLKEDLVYIEAASDELIEAQKELEKVSPEVLPPSFREKLSFAKNKLAQLNQVLNDARQKIPTFLDLLGDRYPHRYLILLQNDTESRPTGGFIGSYIIVDLNDGYITKMDFHDVYELDGQLHEEITPPEDIALVSDNWRMRDSNYSPDFTISAEKTAWFLQKENGPSVDTVIAINQSFIADLLELSGAIHLSGLEAPLDKNNFQFILSYIIESKLTGEENPKQILAELIPAFQKKLLENTTLDKILKAFLKGIREKKILIYSRNESVQEVFDEFNLSSRVELTNPNEDYLNVIVTSIGGNKSDKFITQNIKHYTLIEEDGTQTNEVTITRKHTWTEKDMEVWRSTLKKFGFTEPPDHIKDILGRGVNKSFVKVYVPKGSILLNANGVEMEDVLIKTDEEIRKTYFMVKMEVGAGTQKSVSLIYELPEKLGMHPADSYKFNAQTQAGFLKSYIEKKVFFKAGVKSHRQYPQSFVKNESGFLEYSALLDEDLYLSSLIGT